MSFAISRRSAQYSGTKAHIIRPKDNRAPLLHRKPLGPPSRGSTGNSITKFAVDTTRVASHLCSLPLASSTGPSTFLATTSSMACLNGAGKPGCVMAPVPP